MTDRPVLTLAPVTAPSMTDDTKHTKPPAPAPQAGPDQPGESGAEASAKAPRARKRLSAPATKQAQDSAAEPAQSPWRSWGPFHQTVSFKWPPELVSELDDRRHDLREPVGLMVVAAVTHLLDQSDKTIRMLIDRAEQAKPRSGRPHSRGT